MILPRQEENSLTLTRTIIYASPRFSVVCCQIGDVAQLGERGVRNAEARGSIPLISTN